MEAFSNWSIPLFRFRGVPIRAHWTLGLVALFDFMLLLRGGFPWWLAPVLVALLLLSVLLHEGGHAVATRAVGGRCSEIMLWALGGYAQCTIPMRAGAHLLTAIMGPLVNVGLWAGSTAVLAYFPDVAGNFIAGPCLGYLAFVNLRLALINAIPCHPLDGGHATTAFLWGAVGLHRAVRWTAPIGFVASGLVAAYALYFNQTFLVMFGAWLFYVTYTEQRKLRLGSDFVFGLDQSYAYGGKPGGWFAGWRRRREAARALRLDKEEAAEATVLDELLDKVSTQGLPSLTAAERKLLERISKRQRERA